MKLAFSKMHGLGNDFMVVELLTQHAELAPARIAELADRRTGVGFDQLLLVLPPTVPDADFRYRIFNGDGSEAEQCGNGVRCFARFVADRKLTTKRCLEIETLSGTVTTRLLDDGTVTVDMGVPSVAPDDVPFACEAPGLSQAVDIDGEPIELTPVSVGNPHAVLFVDNIQSADVAGLGSRLSRHARFPNGANIGFCQVVDPGFARLRVFERGVGETRACGTGACAAAVAGHLHGRLGERVKISLPGGKLRISWAGPGHALTMTGPATLVYEGRIEL